MPKELVIKRTSLSYQGGGSDKVYAVELKERDAPAGGKCYVVHCYYGRRGKKLNFSDKTPTPIRLSVANRLYDSVVRQKMAKGYQVDPTVSIPIDQEIPGSLANPAPPKKPVFQQSSPDLRWDW